MTVDHIAAHFHEIEEGDIETFQQMARVAEQYQREHNPVYGAFEGFRYLPIEAFKQRAVCTFDPDDAEAVFLSSGTGGGARSRHFVRRLDLYRRALETGFTRRFGAGPFVIAAYLPGYAEQSSLIFMVRRLIECFGAPGSGFFLNDPGGLEQAAIQAMESGHPLMLFGVAFGLLELVDSNGMKLSAQSIVVETGGMKTMKRSISRSELHDRLCHGLGVQSVVSEYGMCELLSQFWTDSDGIFQAPPWTDFEIISPQNGFQVCPRGEPGALAVFDLANLYSVSAVLTQDRAVRRDGGFEILGRLSGADMRGCNFLLEGHARN